MEISWRLPLLLLGVIIRLAECVLDRPGCVPFKVPKPDDRSIFFSFASGRFGNQLTVYALMLQLQVSLDVDTYVPEECLFYLRKFFTKESIRLRSLEETFCDPESIEWDAYSEHVRPLLLDKSFRNGHMLHLWPRKPNGERKFSSWR